MAGVPLYALSLVLLSLWVVLRPFRSLRTAFLVWWVGLLAFRIIPGAVALRENPNAPGDQDPFLGGYHLIQWLGALLLLRALFGLALWGRARNRRFRLWTALCLLGFLLTVVVPQSGSAGVLLVFPLLLSFRWRRDLGAGGLMLANLTGVTTFFLTLVTFSVTEGGWSGEVPGLQRLAQIAIPLILVYSVATVFATARRVHLSIRRIGRRLVASHLLVALIPFALAAIFLLVSAALYVSTYRGSTAVRLIHRTSADAVRNIARAVEATGEVPSAPFGPEIPGQIVLVRRGDRSLSVGGDSLRCPSDSLLDRRDPSSEIPLLWAGRSLYLRARWEGTTSAGSLRVEALAPLDSTRMAGIGELLAVAVRVNPQVQVIQSNAGVSIQDAPTPADPGADGETPEERPRSIGPADPPGWRLPGGSIITALRWNDPGWETSYIPVISSAGFGEQIVALFSVARENPLATVVLIGLGILAIFFIGTLWVTITMAIEMGRSITRSVGALTTATEALGHGDFAHRIEVEGKDELWSVADSFNRMAADLDRMRAVEREQQRLEEELRLARNIQTRLLPAGPPTMARLELAGLSLPAREVGGDYYDYIQLDGDRLGLAVADVSGKGAPAALLMSAFRAAVRSQDLCGSGPAEVLGRVNRFIHSSVDPGRFITAFLGLLDPASGELRYANAGHDAPLLVRPDGSVDVLSGGGLILGLLPQIVYEEARAEIPEGALLAIYTDGITEARDAGEGFFGEERLRDLLVMERARPCPEILKRLVEEIDAFRSGTHASDDITVILARRV